MLERVISGVVGAVAATTLGKVLVHWHDRCFVLTLGVLFISGHRDRSYVIVISG